MMAAEVGSTPMALALLQAGADVNIVDVVQGFTALMYAARGGHALLVEALLRAGADVNAADENGETALDWAQIGLFNPPNKVVIKMLRDATVETSGESVCCCLVL